MIPIKNVTLEMSLKPFKQTTNPYIEQIITKLFDQWYALTKHADRVSVLLWTADGSEILDYRGNLDDEIEWARYVGGATRKMELNPNDPEGIGLHARPYLYMDNPPTFTYGLLRDIILKIKEIGTAKLNKPVRVGATFDPGPEFAKSPFKYERHPEICCGDTMGRNSFVCAHTLLNADTVSYAGYPHGIPQNTPFGTFFGTQTQHFLTDLELDYIWFSNGFGFGTETWGIRGSIFDGETFHTDRVAQIKEDIISFWRYFREACPDYRIETRGTNLSTGIDLAGDGVPLKDIYEGGFNMLPPPNSPWAAINHDFGIELAGQMSRICELPPQGEYPFRYYPHDPWWMNSPWLDRYGREPHDIYLPLALTRLDENGKTCPPGHIQFLTVDNSLGGLPDQVPNEVIPHILAGLAVSPDAPAPLIWVYPFDEYHELVQEPDRVNELFFGDWYIRGAIAEGLPLNTVVSTGKFLSIQHHQPDYFRQHILLTPVPIANSPVEQAIIDIVSVGGQVILYGALHHASDRLLSVLNLQLAQALDGELHIDLPDGHLDNIAGDFPQKLIHRPTINAGGIQAIVNQADDLTHIVATASHGNQSRIIAMTRQHNQGIIGWVRGTISSRVEPDNRLLVPDDLREVFSGESLLRILLAQFGYVIKLDQYQPDSKSPATLVHRHANAFYFSGFTPDTTTTMRLKFPQGAPILLGYETYIEHGFASYRMPRAWHRECRVFVEQATSSVISCVEVPAVSYWGKRKIMLRGLQNATVRFYPEAGFEASTTTLLNSLAPYYVGDPVNPQLKEEGKDAYIEVKDVTGSLMFLWDLPDQSSEDVHQLTALYD